MKLGQQEIFCINALDNLSRVQAKDCIIKKNSIVFLVNESDMGKAIGRNGANVKELSQKFGKAIELIIYHKQPTIFVEKFFNDVKINEASVGEGEEGKEISLSLTNENKRKILGNSQKIKKARELLKRLYEINHIKIKTS